MTKPLLFGLYLSEHPLNPNEPPLEEEVPTEANTIAEIKAYLDAKGIDYTGKTLKADLLALIEQEG